MKYWRGYLVAVAVLVCTVALTAFASSHWVLVDMIYPYVSRMIMEYLANRNAAISGCIGQTITVLGVLALIVAIAYTVWRKRNPIAWIGWVLAAVMTLNLANVVVYGLNRYSGPLSDDIRIQAKEYSVSELEAATKYFQDKANELAGQVSRDGKGNVQFSDFKTLANQAGDGFRTLTYEEHISTFAGTTLPVKKLGFPLLNSLFGNAGVMIPLTGEAAVNPRVPDVGLPFVMCRMMAKRISIANDQDAAVAAFLACQANESLEFQYSGYLMAYRFCYQELETLPSGASRFRQTESSKLRWDIDHYDNSFAARDDMAYSKSSNEEGAPVRSNVADLLVNWHVQKIILPLHLEEDKMFDPMDETQVDLSGLPNVKTEE